MSLLAPDFLPFFPESLQNGMLYNFYATHSKVVQPTHRRKKLPWMSYSKEHKKKRVIKNSFRKCIIVMDDIASSSRLTEFAHLASIPYETARGYFELTLFFFGRKFCLMSRRIYRSKTATTTNIISWGSFLCSTRRAFSEYDLQWPLYVSSSSLVRNLSLF